LLYTLLFTSIKLRKIHFLDCLAIPRKGKAYPDPHIPVPQLLAYLYQSHDDNQNRPGRVIPSAFKAASPIGLSFLCKNNDLPPETFLQPQNQA